MTTKEQQNNNHRSSDITIDNQEETKSFTSLNQSVSDLSLSDKEQQLKDEIKQFEIENPDETIKPLEYANYRHLRGQLKGRQEARKEALIEVEKMINIFQKNTWKDKRCFEGIKCKTCLPLDWYDEHIDTFKQQLKQLGDK